MAIFKKLLELMRIDGAMVGALTVGGMIPALTALWTSKLGLILGLGGGVTIGLTVQALAMFAIERLSASTCVGDLLDQKAGSEPRKGGIWVPPSGILRQAPLLVWEFNSMVDPAPPGEFSNTQHMGAICRCQADCVNFIQFHTNDAEAAKEQLMYQFGWQEISGAGWRCIQHIPSPLTAQVPIGQADETVPICQPSSEA